MRSAGWMPQLKQTEAARVWELFQADFNREVYFRTEIDLRQCSCLSAPTTDEAEHILKTLPLVAANLIAFYASGDVVQLTIPGKCGERSIQFPTRPTLQMWKPSTTPSSLSRRAVSRTPARSCSVVHTSSSPGKP